MQKRKQKTRKVDDSELERITGGSEYTCPPGRTGGSQVCTPERPTGGSLPLTTDERRPALGDEDETRDFGR